MKPNIRHASIIAALLCTNIGSASTPVYNTSNTPFEKAEWITVDSTKLPLYADYLPVFRLSFDINIKPGNRAAFIFGADDPRLMDSNLNIWGTNAKPGESKIKLEVATSKSDECPDTINIYRVNYTPSDNPERAIASFTLNDLIHTKDNIEVAVNLGNTDIYVNGSKIGYAGVNPIANGGDYIAFPVLGGVGIDISDESEAQISNITLRNYREPYNIIAQIEGTHDKSCMFRFPDCSLPEMRSKIAIDPKREVAKATIYATAMGIYDLYANGSRVNDEYFLPGSTQYNKTHLYHSFDITKYLHPGVNSIGVQLGEGWWSGASTFSGDNWNFYGDRPAFLCSGIIEYTDGSKDTFFTHPESWEYSADGPLKAGSFFQGEVFDSKKRDSEERIWLKTLPLNIEETICKSIGDWRNVNIRPTYGNKVLPIDTITAISISEPRPGVYVYDMGQNMAGVPLIYFDNLKRDQQISIRHGEVLYPDMPQYNDNIGMVMTENLRAAMCRDIYIASGHGKEEFSPRHTLHGYRFLEITGIDTPLPLENVKSIPLSSVHCFKAGFECSDSLVNRLWENIKWSTLSNFISIPTDCPQRNERLGWMGDISVFSPAATKMADISALLEQFLQSVRDCQNENGRFPDVAPTGFGFGGFLWGSAGITVPWQHYCQYGDSAILKDHYEAMKRYMDYIFHEAIEPSTNLLVQERAWGDLGDWLSPEYEKNDKSLIWECYLIYDLEIMSQIANILGYESDANEYQALAEERKQFFAETYVDRDTQKTIWSDFDSSKRGNYVDTQCSYALPLAMGIYDSPSFRDNFTAAIERENRADDGTLCPPFSLMTGFIGTAWIQEALSRIGRDDIAYRLLTSTDYPSWLYPVTQGATTIWERLNSYTHKDGFGNNNSMNSFNHYSFGSVADWLITRCLGIKKSPDGQVSVEPTPDPTGRITYAKGWLDTPYGRVTSSWQRDEDGNVHVDTNIASFQQP